MAWSRGASLMGDDHSRFAVFILTHGRPDNVETIRALDKAGYTGRVYLIIDNEDAKGDEYRRRFGSERVIEFDKAAVARTFDTADTSDDRRTIVYARNASFAIARDLGLDYFAQFDDDYYQFLYRYPRGDRMGHTFIRKMDAVIDLMLGLLDSTGARTVAMAQGGDFIGGIGSTGATTPVLRKAMNSFFCRTDNPFTFLGRLNEDVNAYTLLGSRGDLFLTVTAVQLDQYATQQNAGGMTSAYLDVGTYVKTFYTVMMCPSFVKVSVIGELHHRFHHHVSWDHAVPKIINERYRKAS